MLVNSSNTVQHWAVDTDVAARSILITDASGVEGGIIKWTSGDKLSISAQVANDEIVFGDTASSDVRLTGATADCLWDASANKFYIRDNAILAIGTGSDLSITHDATNTLLTSATGDLIVDNTLATGSSIFRLGTDTSATDFQVQNDSASALLTVDGSGVVTVPLANPVHHGSSSFLVPCYSSAVHQALTGPGAMSLTASYTRWTTSGADAGTLAAPSTVPPGFIKTVQLVSDGGDGTLTVTGLAAANDVWVFSEVGHSLSLMAVNATTWVVIHDGMGDTTVGSMSAFS